jgi:hypothetical protein
MELNEQSNQNALVDANKDQTISLSTTSTTSTKHSETVKRLEDVSMMINKEDDVLDEKIDKVKNQEADTTTTNKTWFHSGLWDLRDKTLCDADERALDCHPLFTHPVIVVIIFTIGIILLLAGAWAMINYALGRYQSITGVWRISVMVFVMVTLLGIMLPYRLRFAYNCYGLLMILLLIEYAMFLCLFPIQFPSDEHVEAANYLKDFIVKEKAKGSTTTIKA